MANSPAQGRPTYPSAATTMWAMVAGWALLKLVAGGTRPAHAPAYRRDVPAGRGDAVQQGSRRGAPFPKKNATAGKEARQDQGGQERGRHADTPTEIPTPGWKDILWRVYEEFGEDRIMAVAAGVTFYALLALFPAIAALVSIYGLFSDPATIEGHLSAVSGVLPGGAMEIISEQVRRIASQGGGALGFGFIFGLLVSLWSANAGVKAVIDALNIVYEEDEKRSFVMLNLQSLAFTLGGILFILLALGGIVVLPVVLGFLGLGGTAETLISLARWPVLLLIVITGLSVIYRYGPSRDKPEWRWVSPGSLVAAVLWLAGSALFSWYVSNFGSYNETYGSLGAVIGFMTWIWLSTIVVLLGAELNAEVEHQTAKDSTEGAHEPMGARGAQMADTLGEAKA
ncbi:YihY/virulence factor BrkB family protein [Microvirga lenta]|uniref:YihY/virulence factor BrkB family protein n=1 Tax=Microvirga lenta TaxID=2881337 RepID=UPI001CFF5726|nr:YihY/virulence factor BrkB family protein [Microvirga lenta]MCB5176412.1 YihY/virulence factor BrkB family protein [Microvirga lenta]